MLHFVENDTSLVLLAHLAPDICFFCFSKLRTCTMLDFEARMIPKLKKPNRFSFFVMPKLVERPLICTEGLWDIALCFINGKGGHFGNNTLAELAGIFKEA